MNDDMLFMRDQYSEAPNWLRVCKEKEVADYLSQWWAKQTINRSFHRDRQQS
jgi:hypothetical protein